MKVAILGTWHVHAKGYTGKAKEFGEVIGVYEENQKWKHEFAQEHGIPEFDTLEELLQSDAEGVIVTSSTDRHANDIIKVAKSGKHIFTEKILAPTVAECETIKQAVEKNGVRFVISFPQKTAAGPRTVKEIADSGEIGEINYFRFRNCHDGSTSHWLPAHFYNKKQCGGGAMIDLGAHGMYLLDWFLGTPDSYRSVFTHSCRDEKDAILNPDAIEDNAVTVMSYRNGAIAVNETGFVSTGCPMTLEVGGTKGYAVFNASRKTVTVTSPERKEEFTAAGAVDLPIISFMKGNTPEGCGIAEAIRLTEMMVGAYVSAQ